MVEKTLAIVIPVFNNWSYTNRAIQDLLKLPADHTIIIVDNGSVDETKNLSEKGFGGRVLVIRNTENLFFAKACNQGFDKAVKLGFQNVMFLNNDIRVFGNPDSWTAPLIARAKKGSIVGPTVGCLDDNLVFICEASKVPTRGFWYISGWCITASVETWQKLVVDEGPWGLEFRFYFEDGDLSFRAKALNIPCEVVPIPVKHFGKATSKKFGLSELYLHSKPIFLDKWKGKV